jgi:hypothetical protein
MTEESSRKEDKSKHFDLLNKKIPVALVISAILLCSVAITSIQYADAITVGIKRFSKNFITSSKKTPNQVNMVDEFNDYVNLPDRYLYVTGTFDNATYAIYNTDMGTITQYLYGGLGYIYHFQYSTLNGTTPYSVVFRQQFDAVGDNASAIIGLTSPPINTSFDINNITGFYVKITPNSNYTVITNGNQTITTQTTKPVTTGWHDIRILLGGFDNTKNLGKAYFYLDGRRMAIVTLYGDQYYKSQLSPFFGINGTDTHTHDGSNIYNDIPHLDIDRIGWGGYRDFTQDYIPDDDFL